MCVREFAYVRVCVYDSVYVCESQDLCRAAVYREEFCV